MVVSKGRIVGTWQRTGADVAPEPFTTFNTAETRALAAAAARYHAFCAGSA